MLTLARRTFGMLGVASHLAEAAFKLAFIMPTATPERRRQLIERWSRGVLDIFGLELRVIGAPPQSTVCRPVLLAGNHISWIDIFAYLSATNARFVAKSEVAAWPLIGGFAKRIGTLFVERNRPRDAIRVSAEIRAALTSGDTVCVFPEGTTTDGSVVLPFSSVLLAPAVACGAAIIPVAIAYRELTGAPTTRTAFIGSDTLVGSIWSLVDGTRSVVEISFLEPIEAGSHDRRAIALAAETAIRKHLGHPAEKGPATPAIPFPAEDI